MKKKIITLCTALSVTSFAYAQNDKGEIRNSLNIYSQKIDSIVTSEKAKMNAELDKIDSQFKEKEINAEKKQQLRTEVAQKYESLINEKIDEQKSNLENATKEMVKNSVLNPASDNRLQYGGFNSFHLRNKKNQDKNPKHEQERFSLSFSFVGNNLTSEGFNSQNNSEIKHSAVLSSNIVLRYENQLGKSTSPLSYRFGVGLRTDNYSPKSGKVFAQDARSLFVEDFSKGNLKKSHLTSLSLYIPLEVKWVLNPKYKEYKGQNYLDNTKNQFYLLGGIYGGLKLSNTLYTRYSNDLSKRIVNREKASHGINDAFFGGKIGVGYGGINLYIQKDFTPTFNNSAQINNKYAFQIGVEFLDINF